MAQVVAFRGVRYDTKKAGDLRSVTAPPYDVISAEELEDLRSRSPYNIVHIDLPNLNPTTEGNPYTEAGKQFRRWLEEGAMQADDKPAIYLYRQRYRVPGTSEEKELTGFIGAVRLARWDEKIILPHERTFAGPKDDRLRLMRAGQAHFSQVYSFYSDPSLRAENALVAAAEGREPDMSVTDDDGSEHRVWVIDDAAAIQEVTEALADRQLYIADGHHRYETSINYRDEQREAQGGPNPKAGWEYSMMMVVNASGGGLTVLPTQRMVRLDGEVDQAAIRTQLEKDFDVQDLPVGSVEESAERAMKAIEGNPAASVLYWPDAMWAVVPRDLDALVGRIEGDASKAWKQLGVTVLHRVVLEQAVGMDRQTQEDGQHITYTKDPREAIQSVIDGKASLACLPNAPSPEVVQEVADQGDAMPQKSTYFYPKALTGLVLSDLSLSVEP